MKTPSIALVIAHPDDEIFASNLLYGCSQVDCRLYVICATDGGGGQLVGDPPIVSQEQLGRHRREELRRSLQIYDIDELVFLGIEDDGLDPEENKVDGNLLRSLTDALREYQELFGVDCFVSHGSEGEYGHPMHRALYRGARKAATECGIGMITFWSNNGWNVADDHTNVGDAASFDVSCDGFPYHKFRSLLAHRTQWMHFAGKQSKQRDYGEALRDYASSHARESYRPVTDPEGKGNTLIHSMARTHKFTTITHGGLHQFWVSVRTLCWRVRQFVRTLRYHLALRTRMKATAKYMKWMLGRLHS